MNSKDAVNFTPWDDRGDGGSLKSVLVRGVEVRPGDRVRLRPLRRADIMDMALDGKVATVESIMQDFEDRIYLAVVIDDDPGRDIGLLRQIGHRFFFTAAEAEPLPPQDSGADPPARGTP